jgi:hypothetical protein
MAKNVRILITTTKEKTLLDTPALYNASKKGLLRVVSNIWTKAINDLSEVVVGTTNDLGLCHSQSKGL